MAHDAPPRCRTADSGEPHRRTDNVHPVARRDVRLSGASRRVLAAAGWWVPSVLNGGSCCLPAAPPAAPGLQALRGAPAGFHLRRCARDCFRAPVSAVTSHARCRRRCCRCRDRLPASWRAVMEARPGVRSVPNYIGPGRPLGAGAAVLPYGDPSTVSLESISALIPADMRLLGCRRPVPADASVEPHVTVSAPPIGHANGTRRVGWRVTRASLRGATATGRRR